jgi:hypothetical protein
VSGPVDIEIPKLADASSAELHRADDGWAISFEGQEPSRDFPIRADSLVEAGVDPTLDRLVTGYVETRLLAAGYGISPREEIPPNSQCAWTLRR